MIAGIVASTRRKTCSNRIVTTFANAPSTIMTDLVALETVQSNLVFRIAKSMFAGFNFSTKSPNTLVMGDFVAPNISIRGPSVDHFALERRAPEFITHIAVFDLTWKNHVMASITATEDILVVHSTGGRGWFDDWFDEMPPYIEVVFEKVYNTQGFTDLAAYNGTPVIPTSSAIYYEVNECAIPKGFKVINCLTPAPVSSLRYDLRKYKAGAPDIPPSTAYSYIGYLKKSALDKKASQITPSDCNLGILATPTVAMLVANGIVIQEKSFTLTDRIYDGGTGQAHTIVSGPDSEYRNTLDVRARWYKDMWEVFGSGEWGNSPWIIENVSMVDAALVVITDFDATINGSVWDYRVDFYNVIIDGVSGNRDPSLPVTHCLHYREN